MDQPSRLVPFPLQTCFYLKNSSSSISLARLGFITLHRDQLIMQEPGESLAHPWAAHMAAQPHGSTHSPWHSKQHQGDAGNINYKHACQAWSSHALNKNSRRAPRWDFSRCQRMGRDSSLAPSLLLFYCNDYLSCKASVLYELYEPSIFHPLKELLYV